MTECVFNDDTCNNCDVIKENKDESNGCEEHCGSHDEESSKKVLCKESKHCNRNKKYHRICVDTNSASTNYIGITDDYVVKLQTSNYHVCVHSSNHPDFTKLLKHMDKCKDVDMEGDKYMVGLLYHALSYNIPSKVDTWVDFRCWN